MSFYFDDDNDDHALSQSFQTSSQQKQVTFSQQSLLSQFSLVTSPEKQPSSQHSTSPSQQQQLSQKPIPSQRTPSKRESGKKPFVCHNCGAIDQYYHDAAGHVTCSNCFTQSQSYGALQEELDYEESQHMAARNRDGTLKRVGSKSKSNATNPDGSALRGRPVIPFWELDKAKKPPSLEVCLRGFQAILQKSCKILCLELLPTLAFTTTQSNENNFNRNSATTESESDNDNESDVCVPGNQMSSDNNHRNNRYCTQAQKKELYRQVSKTVRNLWKAYLLSWKEGAEFYSTLYPQMRFVLRDQFLRPRQRAILYQTLAAKVEEKLTQQIRKEVEEEEANNCSDDDSTTSRDSDSNIDKDSDDESDSTRSNKKIKLEYRQSESTELDALCKLFDQDHAEQKIKEENVVSDDEIPFPDVVLSNEPKISKNPIHHYHSRRPKHSWFPLAGDNNDGIENVHQRQEGNDDSDRDRDDANDDENFSIASDLSIADAAEYKRKGIFSRKRKRTKEKMYASTTNPYAQMIYFHNKMMHLKTKSKKIPQLGRKEAALLIKPSMELVLVILLVAASPHGITEGKLAEWVGNGSLPILDAFGSLLSERLQEELVMLTSFFSLPKAPDAAVLKFQSRKVHVACGYKPPKVKLILPRQALTQLRKRRRPKGRTLSEKSLVAAGRLVRPSSVPMLLGYLVSELGLSQKVLNYSLALMGLSVSRKALKAAEVTKSQGRGRPQQRGTPTNVGVKWDRDASPVFDLSKPSERLRRRKYMNKLAQRRRRAKQRREQGVAVRTIYRNKQYIDRDGDRLDNETRDSLSCQSNPQGGGTPVVNIVNTEWLPPALRKARPDKLCDIDQILAVVIVACKLIPNWERNHHYVFSQGRGPRTETKNSEHTDGITNQQSTIGEYGTDAGESSQVAAAAGLLNLNSKDRFVPWNHEEFRRIGNGKTESEYLEFLKECIFRGNRYALPKFVESLSKSPSLPSDDHDLTNEEDSMKEEELDEIQSNSFVHRDTNTVVVPNDVVLGWKKNPRFEEDHPCHPRDKLKLDRVPYRPTKCTDTAGLRKPDGPLGPLIEYMAYKTGTCPIRILDQLLELDEELASKGKPETPSSSLPPSVCYDLFMGENNALPLSATKEKTPSQKKTRSTQSRYTTPPSAPQTINNTNKNSHSGNYKDTDYELFLAQSSQLGGNDNILAQGSPESDDLNSVTSIYEV